MWATVGVGAVRPSPSRRELLPRRARDGSSSIGWGKEGASDDGRRLAGGRWAGGQQSMQCRRRAGNEQSAAAEPGEEAQRAPYMLYIHIGPYTYIQLLRAAKKRVVVQRAGCVGLAARALASGRIIRSAFTEGPGAGKRRRRERLAAARRPVQLLARSGLSTPHRASVRSLVTPRCLLLNEEMGRRPGL